MAVMDESDRASTGPCLATVDMARLQCAGPRYFEKGQSRGVPRLKDEFLGGTNRAVNTGGSFSGPSVIHDGGASSFNSPCIARYCSTLAPD